MGGGGTTEVDARGEASDGAEDEDAPKTASAPDPTGVSPLDANWNDDSSLDDGSPALVRVTFRDGKAQGGMTGYAWATIGFQGDLVSPTCGGTAITHTAPCSPISTSWNATEAVCITGAIPPLPARATLNDVTGYWGLAICVNATQAIGGTIGQPYKSIKMNFTGVSSGAVQALLHRPGDSNVNTSIFNYCAIISAGIPTPLASFKTLCSDGLGTEFDAADIPNIDQICLYFPANSSGLELENVCLNSIVFGY